MQIVRVDHALVEAQQNVAAAPNTIIMQRFSDELDNLMVSTASCNQNGHSHASLIGLMLAGKEAAIRG